MERAIKIAIENGWKQDKVEAVIGDDGNIYTFGSYRLDDNKALLDPLFWQALGRGLGWEEQSHPWQTPWAYHWHRFIDHLAEGKDIESFFTNLIK